MSRINIHLNRLADALKTQGVSLKRTQILEVAAQAFGYRNSNETAAASKAGELDPPQATPIGRLIFDGTTLIAFEDPTSKQPFATPAKEGDILVAPLGGLVSIPALTAALPDLGAGSATPNHTLYILSTTAPELRYEGWSENEVFALFANAIRLKGDAGEEDESLTQAQRNELLISTYCADNEIEYDVSTIDISGAPGKAPAPTVARFVLTSFNDDEGLYGPYFFENETEALKSFADDLREKDSNLAKREKEGDLEDENEDDNPDLAFIHAYYARYSGQWDIQEIIVEAPHAKKEVENKPAQSSALSCLPDSIWIAAIEADGDIYQFASLEKHGLDPQISGWCLDQLEEKNDPDFVDISQDGADTIIATYFEKHQTHILTIEEISLNDLKSSAAFPDPKLQPGAQIIRHIGLITHKYGSSAFCALTEDHLYQQIADWCRGCWVDAASRDSLYDIKNCSDREIVHKYFEHNERENLEITEAVDIVDLATAATPPTNPLASADHAVVNHPSVSKKHLEELVLALLSGVTEDIWYDASHYGDTWKAKSIEHTQNAMMEAAELLRKLGQNLKPAAVTVHVAEISHRHGNDLCVAGSETELKSQIADYCRISWHENANEKIAALDSNQMSDDDVTDLYETPDDESIECTTHQIDPSQRDISTGVVKLIERSTLTKLEASFAADHIDTCGEFTITHGWAVIIDGRHYLAPAITKSGPNKDDNAKAIESLQDTLQGTIEWKGTGGSFIAWEDKILEHNDGPKLHVLIPFSDAYRHLTPKAWRAEFLGNLTEIISAN